MQTQGAVYSMGGHRAEDKVFFEYRGKDGNVHGPYGASQMRQWVQQASVRLLCEVGFREMDSSLRPRFGRWRPVVVTFGVSVVSARTVPCSIAATRAAFDLLTCS